MAYTVLARKYRSQTFDDVVGQDPIAQTLKNAIKTDRVAHAFLFTGTRGVGKTTMARILAKALNCLSFDRPTTEPCCKCESCVAVNAGEDIDVIEIDGASNNGVDQVRELRENAIYRPARARYKIYIIDEVHMLTTQAFNALLKILEEPPSHVKFIFATTEPNKVIATIQSRCQRFDFSNIGPADIAAQLKDILRREDIKYEEDLIPPLAKMANGSMRDALSLLDRLISTGMQPLNARLLTEFLGCADIEKVYNLIDRVGDNDAAGTLAAVDALVSTGLSEVQIVDALVDTMRDLMVVKSAGAKTELVILTAEQRKRAEELAEKFDIAGLVYSITTLEKLRYSIKTSEGARALLEASLLRFALSEHFLNVDELLTKSGAGGVKKNAIAGQINPGRKPQNLFESQEAAVEIAELGDIEHIRSNWDNIRKAISAELGAGTAAPLASASPTRFDSGVLRLTFGPSDGMSKTMCESNGRKQKIEAVLARYCTGLKRLEFDIADGEQEIQKTQQKRGGISKDKKSTILNDPGVRAILTEFEATVNDIEET
jgi:DNA polymerase-3 subunit gamma/tau